MKTKLILLITLLMLSFSSISNPRINYGEPEEIPSFNYLQTLKELFAYVELLENVVLGDREIIKLMVQNDSLHRQIINNQKLQINNLNLIIDNNTQYQKDLLSINASLNRRLQKHSEKRFMIFGAASLGAVCLFIDNKTLNLIGVGLLGVSFIFVF